MPVPQSQLHMIEPDGGYSEIQLGSDPEAGDFPQAVVKAGCWFASRVRDPGAFALAGCTVAPGFDFADFELGKRSEMIRLFPATSRVDRAIDPKLTFDRR